MAEDYAAQLCMLQLAAAAAQVSLIANVSVEPAYDAGDAHI
jgi:hypothetical protein